LPLDIVVLFLENPASNLLNSSKLSSKSKSHQKCGHSCRSILFLSTKEIKNTAEPMLKQG
jgi:hypothetical protein